MNITQVFSQNRIVKKTLSVAAIGFILVCAIGYIASQIIDSTGVIKNAIAASGGRFDMSFYTHVKGTGAASALAKISIAGIVVIMVSGVLNLIWAFRWQVASRFFIITAFSLYVLGQGIGFGILFVTWQAKDLLAVFGIAGGIFGAMALIGWFSKDLMPLGKLLMIGTFIAMGMGLISIIMYFAHVYSDTMMMAMYGFTGLLTIGWIAFDIWYIKRMSYGSQFDMDKDSEFRIVAFFGFRLLSDLVQLIWIVLRFYAQTQRK